MRVLLHCVLPFHAYDTLFLSVTAYYVTGLLLVCSHTSQQAAAWDTFGLTELCEHVKTQGSGAALVHPIVASASAACNVWSGDV